MRIKTLRTQGADGKVIYKFTATIEEKDLELLPMADGESKQFVIGKLKEFTVGKALRAAHDFNEAMCSKCKYQKPTLPVYYIQVQEALPSIAMYDEVPDLLNNVPGKMNPDFRKWDDSRLLVQLWASSLEQHFFVFSNCTFFDQGYGKGNPEREFGYDLSTRSFTEVSVAAEEEPEKKQEKAVEAAPAEPETGILVPETMPGIWKLLGFKANSLYDLGTRTLSPARKIPTLEASIKAYRRNMLLTVARALVLREYGTAFTAEQVRKSVIASWKNNGRMKKYSEVLRANQGEVEKRVMEILGEIPGYIDGKVESKAKYMETYKGEPWSIKSFVLMCKVTGQFEFKKTGWRSTKKS